MTGLEILGLSASLVCSLEGITGVVLVCSFEMVTRIGQSRTGYTSSNSASSNSCRVARASLASIFFPVGVF
jgi:hypothetical protein